MEDNDDIRQIYEDECEQLKTFYGDFFFTELVEAADKSHRVLVADFEDKPIGATSVTSNISIDLLRKTHYIGHLRWDAGSIFIFSLSGSMRLVDLCESRIFKKLSENFHFFRLHFDFSF